VRKRLLLVIVAALLSAQAQDMVESGHAQDKVESGQDQGVVGGGQNQDVVESGQAQEVVESGQHTQWGSLRYRVVPGQYTVIGELIKGSGVVGVPRVDNPNPRVIAERTDGSTVEYTPSRSGPPPTPPERAPEEGALILRDPLTGEPLAWFSNEAEARYHLTDRLFNDLMSQGHLQMSNSSGGLPHYTQCTSESCREISLSAEEFRKEDQRNAELALRNFVDTVGQVARAIADTVREIVQPVVDFFAKVFEWVENAVKKVVADAGGTGGSPSTGTGGSPSTSNGGSPSGGPSAPPQPGEGLTQ